MSFRARPMEGPDVADACGILNGIIHTGGTTAFEDVISEAGFARMYLEGVDLIACHVVLDTDEKVAGFQWIGRNRELPDDCVDIATFTRRNPPASGAGRALFATTRAFARIEGFKRINATIRADNVPGLGYYTKMGFVDHAVAKGVPLRDGTPVDRISKRYDLDTL